MKPGRRRPAVRTRMPRPRAWLACAAGAAGCLWAAVAGAQAGAPTSMPPATARAIAVAEDRRQFEPDLRRFLADPLASVRARAALAVGRLQDTATVAALVPLLSDPEAAVRQEAVFALGQIGHRPARAALEARVEDRDPATARLAVEALGKLGDRAATPRITPWLSAPDPLRRAEAAVALWRLADSTALEPLLARHDDPDPAVRWRVLYALEKIVAPDRVILIAASHLSDADTWARAYAARTLGRQKSPRANAYLMQALDDAEIAVMVNAIRAMQGVADTACRRCAPAIAARLSHPHPYVRVTAATALAERSMLAGADSAARAAVLDSLVAHLGDRDAATRGNAARALLHHRGAEALAIVAPVLDDPSVYARTIALSGFARLPLEVARPRLLAGLAAGASLFERMTCADLLGELRARDEAPRLRAGLADSAALFAASCAGALQAMGDSASVPAMARAWVERGADADADARNALRDALRELAGRAFADSLERAHPQKPVSDAEPAADFADLPTARGAILHTSAGDIEWAFYREEAPQTVKNFARLAERGYFDGLSVHRVVPNFVIQDGDPTGTGSGGPGWTIRCEYNRLRYEPGMVGMALSGKDTGGSQWFVTHSPQPHLNGRYTIFARVVRGMDVVQRVVQGDRMMKVEILR